MALLRINEFQRRKPAAGDLVHMQRFGDEMQEEAAAINKGKGK